MLKLRRAKAACAKALASQGRKKMPKGRRPHTVLCANRRAGWRFEQWSELDQWSLEAGIRTYALSEIEELDPVIANFDDETLLLLIYGGDGTLLQILNSLLRRKRRKGKPKPKMPIIVPVGGGTMKRLPRWALWNGTPAENAMVALELFEGKRLPHLPLSLLKVEWGRQCYFAVTFMAGATVRIMQEYSRFRTTPAIAGLFSAGALAAAAFDRPKFFTRLYGQIRAKVTSDGEVLQGERFIVVIRDILEELIFSIRPYKGTCAPGQSFSLAYAIDYHEVARKFPWIVTGAVPDNDPRYFNRPASLTIIEPLEELPLTLDGEYFTAKPGETIRISQGPEVKVAVNPFYHLTFLRRIMSQGGRLKEVASYVLPTLKKG